MIPKSGYRFSEKIMLKQKAKAKSQFNPKLFRFSCKPAFPARDSRSDHTLRESRSERFPVQRSLASLHGKQLDIEDQRGIRWNDAAGAARAIAEFGRDNQRALTADFHCGDAFVPAGNDLMLADRK